MKSITVLLLICIGLTNNYANNIQINNVSLTGQNLENGFALLEFDLSWDNSWRLKSGPSNYDATWVFVKYRESGGNWQHASINYVDGNASNDGHTEPLDGTIETPSDGTGVFIYRNAPGSGNVNFTGSRLRWNYEADGVDDDALVDIKVFAIEMVYVPQGNFYAGSSGSEQGAIYKVGAIKTSFLIESENSIIVNNTAGNLFYDASITSVGDQLGPIPASFPKGYNGFYCQKYETTQEQWVEFFNSLSENQKVNNDLTDANHKNSDEVVGGNAISFISGNATTSKPAVPVNYIGWENVNAYLDWAGLRPMTELEYEKACRGTLTPVAEEFAWGNNNLHTAQYSLQNAGEINSSISNMGVGIGNANYVTTRPVSEPIRVGIFAAGALHKNREETGGTYYGIMEMSGNLYERVISIGRPEGRGFDGIHGDGSLDTDGMANVPNWITGAGGGYVGASFTNSSLFLRIADRYDAANNSDIINSRIGFRGVRTKP